MQCGVAVAFPQWDVGCADVKDSASMFGRRRRQESQHRDPWEGVDMTHSGSRFNNHVAPITATGTP